MKLCVCFYYNTVVILIYNCFSIIDYIFKFSKYIYIASILVEVIIF